LARPRDGACRRAGPSDRVVGDHPNLFLLAQREQLALDLTEEKVVAGLHRVQARKAEELAASERAGDLIREEVRAAHVARLAGADHVIQRPQAFVDRRERIGMMELVEIDIVGPEPPQRGVDRVEDVLLREPLIPRAGAHRAEALRGQNEIVTASLEPASDDLFRSPDGLEVAAHRIDVRGVEEGDAVGGGAIEDRPRARLVALQPEGHGAETKPRDGQPGAAETNVLHHPSWGRMSPGHNTTEREFSQAAWWLWALQAVAGLGPRRPRRAYGLRCTIQPTIDPGGHP
jgi:hypothetical protein